MQKLTITGVRVESVRLPPLDPPIGVGRLAVRAIECVLVFLDTDQGITGEGLLIAMMGIRTIRQMVLDLQHLVIGLDPSMGGKFTLEAPRETRFMGTGGAATMAIAGLDMALWDLRAKAAGANVSQLLGACRSSVPTYHSSGLWAELSLDGLRASAAAILAKGFRGMKMRLGASAAEDVRRVRAIREVIGPDIALMADANQRWSVTEAIRRGRMLAEFDLTWLEEPVHHKNHEGEARVRAALPMPLASGESEYTPLGILEMLRCGSADVLMPDLQRMGGPTAFLEAAHLASAFKTDVSSHLFHEMSLPLLACLPGATYLEYMPWFEPVYRQRLQLDGNGEAVVQSGAGWGFELDLDAVARYRI